MLHRCGLSRRKKLLSWGLPLVMGFGVVFIRLRQLWVAEMVWGLLKIRELVIGVLMRGVLWIGVLWMVGLGGKLVGLHRSNWHPHGHQDKPHLLLLLRTVYTSLMLHRWQGFPPPLAGH